MWARARGSSLEDMSTPEHPEVAESPEARARADAMPPAERAALRDLAEELAVEAGVLAVERRRAGVRVADVKSSPVDVVTAVDREVEALIRARLAERRPDDGFHGEESGTGASASGVSWIVDPIDGTVNYLYGVPWYAVSIAVVAGDPAAPAADYATIAGAVVNPELDERYRGVRGGGAELGGERIACGSEVDLSHALVGTGFGYSAERRARQAAAWAELAPRVRDLRRQGAAALDLCSVASGRLDLYYETGTHAWDHAAGALIAREAGAVVVGPDGGRESERLLVAGAPALVERFAAVLPAGLVERD